MLNLRNGLIMLAMAAVSFTAGAQEIYKSVNEDGVVEYSDMPAPDAQEIDVDPNVVEMAPEKRQAAPPEAAPAARERTVDADAGERREREAADGDDVVYVDGGIDRRQREKTEAKERAGAVKEKQREGGNKGRGREAGEGASRPGGGGRINRGGRPGGGRGR